MGCLVYVVCVMALSRLVTCQLSNTEKKAMLDRHNAKRALEEGSDMEVMTWDNALATRAQNWASACYLGHSETSLAVGENLYMAWPTRPLVTAPVDNWYDEIQWFYYDYNYCNAPDGKSCGHYTQVVWAKTNRLGCGYANCTNRHYFVCNYGPAGNVNGGIPYSKGGKVCTQCANGKGWCTSEGLCNNGCFGAGNNCECKADCLNCGKKDSGRCSCACADGYHGSDCSAKCVDSHQYCWSNPGWPDSWCNNTEYHYVNTYCPAKCGLCVKFSSEPTC